MNRRVSLFFTFFTLLIGLFLVQVAWLAGRGSDAGSLAQKRTFVALTGLPDLAVATEARFLRFRSLADV
ncbi:hypothetical protein, partial [Hydrogenimonas sp.]